MSEYKTICPRCGGEVRIASIKCKHCDEHSDIDKSLVQSSEIKKGKPLTVVPFLIGWFLLLLIYCSASLQNGPSVTLQFIACGGSVLLLTPLLGVITYGLYWGFWGKKQKAQWEAEQGEEHELVKL